LGKVGKTPWDVNGKGGWEAKNKQAEGEVRVPVVWMRLTRGKWRKITTYYSEPKKQGRERK